MNKRKQSVAIIDPHSDIARAYQQRLAVEGYEAIVFADAADSLGYLIDVGVDALIMELDLVDMPALELIEILKSNPNCSHIPIIVLANIADFDFSQKARELGASDYLIKSTTSGSDVVDRIRQLLKY